MSQQATAIKLDWTTYPVNDPLIRPLSRELLLTRIELAEARMLRVFDNDSLIRLPGNTSIIKVITRTSASPELSVVCCADIDNLKPYNDRYGFCEGDDVILMVFQIMANVFDELARQDSFIGHVGGDYRPLRSG